MSAGNRCDCCCECGLFCTDGKCGRDYNFTGTAVGSSNGSSGNCAGSGNAADCDFSLNVSFAYVFLGSGDAATWNASFKPPGAAFDAKTGSRVCRWQSSDVAGTICAGAQTSLTGGVLSMYFGTDDKWHSTVDMPYEETTGVTGSLSGDAEFAGGGAPMDCEAFSLSIPLTQYLSGTAVECNPPTSITIVNTP